MRRSIAKLVLLLVPLDHFVLATYILQDDYTSASFFDMVEFFTVS